MEVAFTEVMNCLSVAKTPGTGCCRFSGIGTTSLEPYLPLSFFRLAWIDGVDLQRRGGRHVQHELAARAVERQTSRFEVWPIAVPTAEPLPTLEPLGQVVSPDWTVDAEQVLNFLGLKTRPCRSG